MHHIDPQRQARVMPLEDDPRRQRLVPVSTLLLDVSSYHVLTPISFASCLNTDKYLAVSGAQDKDGAEVMTYAKSTASHFQFKLKTPMY